MLLFCAVLLTTYAYAAPPVCDTGQYRIDANFSGGNYAACKVVSAREVVLEISPEDAPPINPSPWYAFRITPEQPGDLQVRLRFIDGPPRYWPKRSEDGKTWQRLGERAVNVDAENKQITMQLSLSGEPLWVSAQKLWVQKDYQEWMAGFVTKGVVKNKTLGRSVQKRPIQMIYTPQKKKQAVLLLGRQHPSEVSGAIAMRYFVEVLLGDSQLALNFRERFALYIVPLINPDGVELGHWRHNLNGVDLNRDWGPFTQPETKSVARLLRRLKKNGGGVEVGL